MNYPDQTAFVFDVDGTITDSRQPILPEHADMFNRFISMNDVYLLTGSDFAKTKEQLGDITYNVIGSYQCAGNELWVNDELVATSPEFVPTPRVREWFKQKLRESPFTLRTGLHEDYRAGMMNFSIVGRGCTLKERLIYAEWDDQNREREQMVAEFNRLFSGKFVAQIAGRTGIDIAEEGRDKGQVFFKLDPMYDVIKFFGDDMQEGGNDWPFANHIRKFPHRCYSVNSPQETFEIINESL